MIIGFIGFGEAARAFQESLRERDASLTFAAYDILLDNAATAPAMCNEMERRGVAIDIDVPRSLPAVRGIQAELEQLLLNLVANARDALADGGTLTIHAAPDDGGGVLVLTVRDTGTGIPPELLARIQEPFFTTKEHGHGLGLAICRSIVSQLRGRIVFASQPGHGTLVTVRLPVAEGTDG